MAIYKVTVFDCQAAPPRLAWSVEVDLAGENELAAVVPRVLAQARHETRNPLLDYSLNVRSPRPGGYGPSDW